MLITVFPLFSRLMELNMVTERSESVCVFVSVCVTVRKTWVDDDDNDDNDGKVLLAHKCVGLNVAESGNMVLNSILIM